MGLPKTLLKRTPLVVVSIGLALALVIILCLVLISSTRSKSKVQNASATLAAKTTAPSKQPEPTAGFPVRLKIPEINVDAALDYVGLTPQGALGVPKGPADAAWYDGGPRPGEQGDAVIDGHYGWEDNIPAVFDNLHELQNGDNVYVVDDKGATTTFIVREVQTYGSSEDASDVFRASDGKAHLVLITCEGTWNETLQSYSNRLVVFADKVNG
ncbi:MAG: class F sortase [Candidatus Saccharimonadales bacterium]|jgi:LPXTG-site transpeptidase (sortase) family protein